MQQIKWSEKWLEVNTFTCPMGRITPEQCKKFRGQDVMPEPCQKCKIFLERWDEIREKRRKLIEEMRQEVERKWEERWEVRKKPKAQIVKPETRKYTIVLLEMMLGTIPLNKELYTDYIAQKYLGKDKVQTIDQKLKNIEEEEELIEEVVEKGTTGFFKDDKGIYIMDYHIKGFLKEAGNILKDAIGIRNLKSKIDNYVFVHPRKIYLAPAPSGYYERPLRAMTMQGPRVSLVRSEVVEPGIKFDIEIIILPNKEINFDVIETLLCYGCYKGLGQWRNAGYGAFTWFRTEEQGQS